MCYKQKKRLNKKLLFPNFFLLPLLWWSHLGYGHGGRFLSWGVTMAKNYNLSSIKGLPFWIFLQYNIFETWRRRRGDGPVHIPQVAIISPHPINAPLMAAWLRELDPRPLPPLHATRSWLFVFDIHSLFCSRSDFKANKPDTELNHKSELRSLKREGLLSWGKR